MDFDIGAREKAEKYDQLIQNQRPKIQEFRLAINALEDSYQLKLNGLKEKLEALKAHNQDLDRQKEIIDRQVFT